MKLVDLHAEATSEKIAMGYYLDGKVSCVFGTHTHVVTADPIAARRACPERSRMGLPCGVLTVTRLTLRGRRYFVIPAQAGIYLV